MQIRIYSKTIGFITSVISWLYRTHCCCFVICFASVCKGNTIFRFLYQWRLPWRRVQQFTWFSAKTLICWATTSGLDTSRCWQTQAQTCQTHPEILADTLKLFSRHVKKTCYYYHWEMIIRLVIKLSSLAWNGGGKMRLCQSSPSNDGLEVSTLYYLFAAVLLWIKYVSCPLDANSNCDVWQYKSFYL